MSHQLIAVTSIVRGGVTRTFRKPAVNFTGINRQLVGAYKISLDDTDTNLYIGASSVLTGIKKVLLVNAILEAVNGKTCVVKYDNAQNAFRFYFQGPLDGAGTDSASPLVEAEDAAALKAALEDFVASGDDPDKPVLFIEAIGQQ